MLAGGVSINMVTKDGGNKWRGNARYNFANDGLQSENWADDAAAQSRRSSATRPRRPTTSTCRAAAPLIQNRVWVNGTIRKWVVNKLVNATNADGSQALDDNDLKNYSGKVVDADHAEQQAVGVYFWNNKIRGHRRDSDDQHSRHRVGRADQPGPDDAGEVHRHRGRAGVRVELQRHGRPDQLHLPARHAGRRDPHHRHRHDAKCSIAATREEHQPNSRHQFDNVVSFGKSGWGGEHLFKGGVQWGRLYYESDYSVQGDH